MTQTTDPAPAESGPAVQIHELVEQPVVRIRATVRVADLAGALDDRIAEFRAYFQRHGARPSGPTYVRYHSFPDIGPDSDVGELVADVEQGFPVDGALPSEGSIVADVLPGGTAITTEYIGVPQGLGVAYGRIAAWLSEHDAAPDGPSWEVYHFVDLDRHEDHAHLPDPATWRHGLVQPIA
ncbi:MAG: GyrI-like domain-containing protein [Actinobacteria bacterium]|nr:GyrI-like domain-containing protein [Actinomycetota bacterium]